MKRLSELTETLRFGVNSRQRPCSVPFGISEHLATGPIYAQHQSKAVLDIRTGRVWECRGPL